MCAAWLLRLLDHSPRLRSLAPLLICLPVSLIRVDSLIAQQPAPTGNDAAAAQPADAEMAKRFEAFAKLLSGSTMKGFFSIDGRESELKEDSYEIKSASKLPTGDLWLFNVRIRYGDHDVTAPLPITVNWADKTPVIVVDKLTIPGLGTFDARVVFSGDRYAGTWQHGDVGGHLFGTIVSPAAPEKPESESAERAQ